VEEEESESIAMLAKTPDHDLPKDEIRRLSHKSATDDQKPPIARAQRPRFIEEIACYNNVLPYGRISAEV
jgi:hypothetical protein